MITFKLITTILFFLTSLSVFAQKSNGFNGRFENIVKAEVPSKYLNSVSYGVVIVDENSGDILKSEYVNRDKQLYPASTIKTVIAMAVLKKIDQGLIRLDQDITINQSNANYECVDSKCSLYGFGKKRTVEKLLWDMITQSNNIATNQLLDVAGKQNIKEIIASCGAEGVKVGRKVYAHVDAEPKSKESNRATAYGLAEIYREISTGRLGLLKDESRNYLINMLGSLEHNDRLNFYFPKNTKFYHKTGHTAKTSGDAGWLKLGEHRIAIIVGLQGFPNYSPLQKIGIKTLNLINSDL